MTEPSAPTFTTAEQAAAFVAACDQQKAEAFNTGEVGGAFFTGLTHQGVPDDCATEITSDYVATLLAMANLNREED